MFLKIRKFFTKNYVAVIVGVIILIAAFFRIYKIQDYLTFLGDEGRDVLIVRDILHGHLTFLGPRASAADFFTGPIYYYMMAPFLLLSNYNPTGPAIMIALLSVATVFLIYKFGREWIGLKGALFAALLYSISPLVIEYSRSSWNPNPMPFFSMVMLYLLYKYVQKPSFRKFISVGFIYGIAFQLHYIEVFVGIIIAVYILSANFLNNKKKIVYETAKEYLGFAIGFLIGLSPFLLFEIKHGFPNTRTVFNFILHGDPHASDLTHLTFIQTVQDVFFRIFARLVLYYPPPDRTYTVEKNALFLWGVLAVVLGIASVFSIIKIKDKLVKLLFSFWLFFGVVLFGFYHKPIYDYYFEFMFPLPFLLVGNLLSNLYDRKSLRYATIILFILFIYLNLLGYPFRYPGNQQYLQVKKISEFILNKAGNKPFNFALITGGNSDHAYRYIFEVEGKPPVTIQYEGVDPQRKSVTDQLFIVCEDLNCQPLGNSLWEVAGFGRAEIAGEWPVSVLKVYKLVHYR
ncbi:MAG TPA: glycosyltransferase family 39 protein [Patescibacteria group bacterium]|nr:glycosyltransferase family 39 protein [Patescibacteria group bacterium]